jgi:4-amino-4-deoxy-L-arabinose transferase-like glycosyltransferase
MNTAPAKGEGRREKGERRTGGRTAVLALLLAAAIIPYFIDLDGSSIWDANEAFYADTPREMMERHDYVTPAFNYEPRLNKPVLSYWIVVAFYQLFGVSVGVQRIPIAFGGLVLIATAFLLARALAPREEHAPGMRTEAALWAALGLAVTPRLLMFARRIFIDIYISMFMGLTLLFFVLAERYPGRRRLFLVLMYVAAGLGVLTKGPVAVVLPGLAFAIYLIVYREWRRIPSLMLPAGAVIVSAIVAPWCVALYLKHGWAPLAEFIVGENVARYTTGVGVDNNRGVLFYIPVLISDSFPWSMFLFVAAARWWSSRRNGSRLASGAAMPAAASLDASGPAVNRLQALCFIWIAVIVGFFSLSAGKQDLYIYPVVPAVAALAGLTLAGGLTPGVRWTTVTIGAIVSIAGAGVLYLFGPGASVYALAGALPMGVMAFAGGLFAIAAALMRRVRPALVAIVVTFVVLDWVFVLRVLPDFERYKPSPGFAKTLAPRIQPDDLLLTYDEAMPSLVFYLHRHIDPFFLEDEVLARFGIGQKVYLILSEENYRRLLPRIAEPTCVIDRRPTFDVKLKNVINKDSLPHLVLITNTCGGAR